MRIKTYDIGDLIRLRGSFANLDGDSVDPTNVAISYRRETGSITTKTYPDDDEIVRTEAGEFYMDIEVDDDGVWHYRVAGTGAVISAAERQFNVRPSNFV